MNLHAIVSGAIGVVNPHVAATCRRATGYTTGDDGTQVPAYTDTPIVAQVQALTFSDLQKLDGLNIQGVRRAAYFSGFSAGVVRPDLEGGDLIVFPSGTLPEGDVWLAAVALETWPDWVKIALTLQNDS